MKDRRQSEEENAAKEENDQTEDQNEIQKQTQNGIDEERETEAGVEALPIIKAQDRDRTRTTLSISRAEIVDALAADATVANNDIFPPNNNSGNSDDSGMVVDVEHIPVRDDPRKWSWRKKHFVLGVVTYAAITVSFSANIYLPAIDSLQRSLHASNQIISLSVSVFILLQGICPLVWSTFTELWGRKPVYLISMTIFVASTVVVSRASNPAIFLVFRLLSAIGSSAVMAIGAGTLADIFDSEIRGQKLGVYYVAPLIGPSLGTLLGGALASAANWRATFYFVAGTSAISLLSFVFLPDTFRKERSLTWRYAYQRAQAQKKVAPSQDKEKDNHNTAVIIDENFRPSLRDLNPLSAIGRVLNSWNVVGAMLCSSILYGAQYSLLFTASTALAKAPWNYSAILIGLVLVAYGVGQIVGSVCGGRYSDWMLASLTKKNGGKSVPEFRIRSTYVAMPVVIVAFALAGWAIQYHWHVAGLCAIFVAGGLSNIWCFSSLIAFQVDCNPGQSTTAVACNSSGRGIVGLIASEVAGPIYRAVGQGPLYSGWAVLIFLSEIFLLTVLNVNKRRR